MFLYPKLNVEPINVKNKNRNNRMDPENSCSIGHGVASVTGLCNFEKLVNFLTNLAKTFCSFLVNFENITLRLVTVVAIFGQLLENLGFF